MASEMDEGIDKQRVLSAILHPDPVPFPSMSAQHRPPSATRRVIPVPTGLSRWTSHRGEISAIVTAFVAVVWLSVGLALPAGGPLLIGVVFAIGALAIWLLEIWNED